VKSKNRRITFRAPIKIPTKSLKDGRRFVGKMLRRNEMSLGTILLIVVVLMLIGAIPSWPHSRGWGYAPSGGIGVVLVILLVLMLLGRI
jgi:hypothetical protein